MTTPEPTPRTEPDAVMSRITAIVEDGRAGNRDRARAALTAVWSELGDAGDPFHRCTLAHYLADLQPRADEALRWDERALAAAHELTDERLRRYHPSLTVAGFLPSLHLNLADGHRRLGDGEAARRQLALAHERLDGLPDGPYRDGVLAGLGNVARALEAGDTGPLDTHP